MKIGKRYKFKTIPDAKHLAGHVITISNVTKRTVWFKHRGKDVYMYHNEFKGLTEPLTKSSGSNLVFNFLVDD
jgi:hypothetical protein